MNNANTLISEFIKRLVILIQDRPFRFKDTRKADAVHYLKQLTTVEGLSEEEISTLQTSLQVSFPTVFRGYLQSLGKVHGDLFKGSEVNPKRYKEYEQWAKTLLQENSVPSFLTDTTVVFLFHQGYSFNYFEAADMFDVPVYSYTEGNTSPKKIADTFSEFLDTEIQRMEHINQTLHLSGGYFLTVNQQGIKQAFPARNEPIQPLEHDDHFID